MGTLKRPKKWRADQPVLFTGGGELATTSAKSGEPVVITDPLSQKKKPLALRSALLGNNNTIPSKADSDGQPDERKELDDGPDESSRFQRNGNRMSLYERYGRHMSVYHKRVANEVIHLDASDVPSSRCQAAAYLTRSMLIVEVIGDVADMPDMILCRFHADEFPAPTREAWRLTVNLFDRALAACVRAEAAWERGEMADADYQTLRTRWAAVSAMYARMPRVCEWGTDVDGAGSVNGA